MPISIEQFITFIAHPTASRSDLQTSAIATFQDVMAPVLSISLIAALTFSGSLPAMAAEEPSVILHSEDALPEDVLPEDVLPEDVLSEDVLDELLYEEELSEDVLPSDMLASDTPLETTLPNPGTGDFPDPSLEGWRLHSFNGRTRYEIVDADGAKVLKATSNDSASLLYQEKVIPIKDTPWIEWTWRVENTLGPVVEHTRAGSDYPGRVTVIIQTGFLPWDNTSVSYVWSSSSEKGSHWESPFTDKAVMVAVESGDENLGKWKTERRNVVEDFKTLLGLDIDQLDAYAVMTDSDNSGTAATAYFGNISFSAE